MSSFDRSIGRGLRALVLLAPALLMTAACGFQPLYGDRGVQASVPEELARVEIATIPDRPGQQLRNLLIDRFHARGADGSPAHRLEISLIAQEQKLAVRDDASAVRSQLNVNAPYRLVEVQTGKVVLSANARSMVSFNVLEQHYAGVVTVENAYERALRSISDDITTRVSIYLGSKS